MPGDYPVEVWVALTFGWHPDIIASLDPWFLDELIAAHAAREEVRSRAARRDEDDRTSRVSIEDYPF